MSRREHLLLREEADEKPGPEGEWMWSVRAAHLSSGGHRYGKLTALDCRLVLNRPSAGAMRPIPSLPQGWDQMSLACQGMVPAASRLCPAPGKMSWQLRKGWEWDCDSAEAGLGGGPRGHMLGKVSFPPALPRVMKRLPG